MADIIRVNASVLTDLAAGLKNIAAQIQNIEGKINSISLDEEAGAEYKVDISQRHLKYGTDFGGVRTAEEYLKTFAMVAYGENLAANTISRNFAEVIDRFAECENTLIKAVGKETNLSSMEEINTENNQLDEHALLYKKIEGEHSRYDDIKNSNPFYKESTPYNINCQRCVVAYELRRRGYDVQAMPNYRYNSFQQWWLSPSEKDYYEYQKDVYEHWDEYFKEAEWISVGEKNDSNSTKNKIISQMSDFGPGARAEIYVDWKGGGAHVFIAENVDGKIQFMDPQSGKIDVSYYFSDSVMIAEETRMCRIDNLEPSEYVTGCVRNSNSRDS